MTRVLTRAAVVGCRTVRRLTRVERARWPEIDATVEASCAAAYRRGGTIRLAREAIGQIADAVRVAAASACGRDPSGLVAAARSPRLRRSVKGGRMRMVMDDVRRAVRRLVAQPAPALGAVAMLALAIGLTTAMFSLVDTLLVRPVPFPEAERLYNLQMMGPHGGPNVVSAGVYRAWRATPGFDRVEGMSPETFLLDEGATLSSETGVFVSPGMLDMLGAQPIAGRLFTADEGRAGSDDRVLISEDVWRSRFGRDPAAIGGFVRVDGRQMTIVGVLPDDFRFPEWNTAVWRPLDFLALPASQSGRRPKAVIRVAPGVPHHDAMTMATSAAHEIEPSLPDNYWAWSLTLASPYRGAYARAAAPVLAAGAVLVFLVLCANVSGLLLARLDARLREIGVAAALGASRVRLLREALAESICLAGAGLVLGLTLAGALLALARAWMPEALLAHTLNTIDLDARAFTAASASGVLAVLLAGLLPAIFATRVSPMVVLRPAVRGASESRGSRTALRVLLVSEIALAFTLLVGGALLTRSFQTLVAAERGVASDGVVTAWVTDLAPPGAERAGRAAGALLIEDAIRTLPGVQTVALSYGAPLNAGGFSVGDWFSDVPGTSAIDMEVDRYQVGADFFDLYGIPILRGRTFAPNDPENAVIVGERLATLLWPGIDPLGRSFRMGDSEPFTVVGLARETHVPTTELRTDNPEFYFAFTPGGTYVTLNIRCGPCPELARFRQAIVDARAGANVWRIGVLDRAYRAHVESPRAAAALVVTFAVVAVLAVAGGLFAVLSYAAGRRRREFGIRLALGARPHELRGLVLREGARVVLVGAALGAVGAWWLSKALTSLMYGVSRTDPASWLVVLVLLVATALLASWRPAARASRLDPSRLLREE